MNKKFKLTEETKEWYGTKLYRIEAITSFGNISKGEKGGFVEKEENLIKHDLGLSAGEKGWEKDWQAASASDINNAISADIEFSPQKKQKSPPNRRT